MEPAITYKAGTDTTKLGEATKNATEAAQDLGGALKRYKALQRRRLHRIVVYSGLFALIVLVFFIKVHWLAKVGFEIVLLSIACFIWAIDSAKEMDEDPHPPRDERIMKKEFERRKK